MQGVIRGSSLAALALIPLGLAAWPGSACAQNTNPAVGAPVSSSALPTTPITLNVESADLYYTLKLLFAQVKANFTLDTSLRGALVTAKLNQVPFDIALNAILKASGQPLTYSYEDGILSIVPQTLIEEPGPSLPGTPSAQEPPANAPYQKLTLSTASVYDVMYALGRPVVQIPTGFGGGGMGGNGGFGTPGIGGSYGGFGNGSNGFGNGAQGGGFQGNTGGMNGFNGRGGFGQGAGGQASGGFGAAGGLIPQGVQDIFGFGPDNSILTRDP
jgi:hypothetical protein